MDVVTLEIPDVKLLTPRRHQDARGFLSESYSHRAFQAAGIDDVFVQENHSHSVGSWTLRGLHFQSPPQAQAKLVRVVRGRIWDVAVDLRRFSPTFGRYAAATLSADGGTQLYVPVGFAHGFLTLEPDCEIIYKVSAYYAPQHDKGIAWDDSDLKIAWPLAGRQPVLSEKDQSQPKLNQCSASF